MPSQYGIPENHSLILLPPSNKQSRTILFTKQMANKDLFEQAIADAKKLKEISMANAKQAIEEAFAPRIQEMFRMKLSEIDDATAEVEDDIKDMMLEDDMENMEEGEMTQTSPETVDEMTLEEILAELELEEDYQEEGEEPIQEAKKKEDDEDAEEADDESSDSGEIVDMSVDEFQNMIKDVLMDVLGKQGEAGEMEEPAEEETKEGGKEKAEGEDETIELAENGVISLDEILAELQDSNYMEEDLKGMLGKIGSGLKSAGKKVMSSLSLAAQRAKYIKGATAEDGKGCTGFDMTEAEVIACVSKNYTARTGQKAERNPEYYTVASSGGPLSSVGFTGAMEEGHDNMEEDLKGMLGKIGSGLKSAGKKVMSSLSLASERAKYIKGATEEDGKGCTGFDMTEAEVIACVSKNYTARTGQKAERNPDYHTVTSGGGPLSSVGFTGAMRESELNEAIQVINTLKSQLNEVNLLNAKLLYVNKLFKAKNLTEAQKVKVISAFDRATTIRETKNVYAILSESLTTNAAPKKAQLKESLGFASKPIGSAPARPIVEADAYVYRMQQLAGLRQPNI